MAAKKVAHFDQRKSISTALKHGIQVDGLCLGLSSKWCSFIDRHVDNQPGMNFHAASTRLQQLETLDAIRLFTTEQTLRETKIFTEPALDAARTDVAKTVSRVLRELGNFTDERHRIARALQDYNFDLTYIALLKWTTDCITNISGRAIKKVLPFEWEHLHRILGFKGPALLCFQTYASDDAAAHAIAAYTKDNDETLLFDPNFGEYLATSEEERKDWLDRTKSAYNPHRKPEQDKEHVSYFRL